MMDMDWSIPFGLENLAVVDNLFIQQNIEFGEIICGCCEGQNSYNVYSSNGNMLFRAKEDSGCCKRNCCGRLRPYYMNVSDGSGSNVIQMDRPFRCDSCWFPCCLQSMKVYAPPGVLAGTVSQSWSCFPKFTVKDSSGTTVLRISGPLCCMSSCCCCDVEFIVKDAGGVEVGKISKKWGGLLQEAFTDADNYGISFPMNLSPQVKATVLGACFLIDFMYFEKKKQSHD